MRNEVNLSFKEQMKHEQFIFSKNTKPPLMLIKDFFCLFSFLACFPPLKYLPHHPLQWTTNFGKEKMSRRVTLEIKTNWIEEKKQMVKGHTYSSIKGVIHICQMPVVCLLAPQSGALRITPFRDFLPIPIHSPMTAFFFFFKLVSISQGKTQGQFPIEWFWALTFDWSVLHCAHGV